ncbi:hypothetical protein [Paragemmobacter straminiformis]|uniref:Lipoprotein n=1 Tax=Paragemmobacter straminiformis TaxID=2045119 RepID=A0A842HZ86_9RHOB|nr:hypothetical protein [Gemmobacter straminiformis]MBC2833952.1 hypothetical protein [Gemmobacter straminiformis]
MIGASKILTVSYGTFSCTLEGFDDPFNTMRAIAEYFRDLAAEDRYFGAEPPTPDAAMLHRIAEREVQRRVDAKVQENGIVLRATGDSTAAPAERPAVAPAVAEAPAVVAAAAPAMVAAAAPAMVAAAPAPSVAAVASPAAQPAADAAPASAAPESIAERLLRLRSEVAAQQESPAVPVPGPASRETVVLPDYVEDAIDTAGTAAAAQAAFMADADAEPRPVTADTVDAPPPAHPAAAEAPAADTPVAAEAEAEADQSPVAAEAGAEADQPLVAAILASLDPLPEDRAAETADLPEDAAEDDLPESGDLPESLVAALAGQSGHMLDFAEDLDAEAPAPSTFAEAEAETETASAAKVTSDDEDDLDDIFAEADLADEADEPSLAALQPDFEDDTPAPALTAAKAEAPLELRPGAADKLQRARARVIRIRRSDISDAAPADTAPAAAPLSPEAELDLERELAGLDAQDTPAQDTAAQDTAAQDTSALGARASANPFGDDPSAEDAVSRLMAQADTEMEGEETKRRRSAIAHLKAAVAQTVAERRAGETKPSPEPSRIARYRNDLAMVVRSALPGGTPTPPKPAGERPAPLVLVSEQRIDRPRPPGGPIPAAATTSAPAIAQPVRPRRVSSSGSGLAMQAQAYDAGDIDDLDLDLDLEDALADDIAAEGQPEGLVDPQGAKHAFRDFAESLGATSMRDMMEAAAAYLTCVLNRPHFTRPQLMRQMSDMIPQIETLREDALRVFGTLLRDGHLVKVRRGQFTLTEASPFHARAKDLS